MPFPGNFSNNHLPQLYSNPLQAPSLSGSHSRMSDYTNNTELTTSTRRHQDITSSRKKPDPRHLSYYFGTKTYDVLSRAKELFALEAYSNGIFFYHDQSPSLHCIPGFAAHAIDQASSVLCCMCSAPIFFFIVELKLLYSDPVQMTQHMVVLVSASTL